MKRSKRRKKKKEQDKFIPKCDDKRISNRAYPLWVWRVGEGGGRREGGWWGGKSRNVKCWKLQKRDL